jgi:hypothetical protein
VGIPATSENGTSDSIIVMVTSSENTEVENSASCTAYCVVNVTPPPPGTSPLVYVGVAVVVVIIAAVLIIKPF